MQKKQTYSCPKCQHEVTILQGVPIELEQEYDAYFTRMEAANKTPLSYEEWLKVRQA